MYISNSFTKQFTPALNNIRRSHLGPIQPAKPNFANPKANLLQPNPTPSKAWTDWGKTQSVAPKVSQGNSTVPSSSAPKYNPGLVTTPSSQMGTTNVTGSVPQSTVSSITPPAGAVTGTNTKGGLAKAKDPNQLSYGGLVKGLVDVSKPSKSQQDLQKKIQQEADANKAIGENAKNIAAQYGDQIAQVGKLGAGAVAGDMSTGSNIVGSGNAAIASQSASSRMNALANAEQAALQGTGQQLTGQAQTQAGYNQAASNANTQQAAAISGTSQAAGYAQPTPAAYGQTTFNPLTGEYSGNSGLPAETMAQYAQMAANGQYSAIPASITSNPQLSAELNRAAQAINPGFNPITSVVQGNIAATNLTNLGTAQTAGQAGVLQNLPMMEAADTAAQGIKDKTITYLAANPQLNPNDANLANQFDAWVKGQQLSDPKYQTLFTYLNEYTNTLAPILGVGGNPTNLKTEIAASFINPTAGAPSIAEVMNNLTALSQGKIQDLKSGAFGGGTVSSPQS